jgi:hypothetical protein
MMDIMQQIDSYPDFLDPLKEAARRYLKYPSNLKLDGVINIGHRPWVAELNYMLMLYPGVKSDSLDRYCRRFKVEIPEMYANFLRQVNGAFCFGMSLCGIPSSMLGNPPLLDRTILQCHDLATASTKWVKEYKVPSDFFHFGSRHFSWSANVGYFIGKDNRIRCVKGKSKIIAEWVSFKDFLTDELQASERLEEQLHPSQWSTQ